MKKHRIRCLIIKWSIISVSLALVSFLIIYSLQGIGYPGINVPATLVINGKKIADKSIRIFETNELCSSIPFTTLLEELGYPVQWIGEKTAFVVINGEEYYYSSSEPALYKPDEERNYIIPPQELSGIPASYHGDQMYLESRSVLATMDNLGVKIELTLDLENRLVIINGPIT